MSGRSLAAAAAALALAGSAGCGDDAEPLRVGLLRDCSGLLGSTKDGAVAGAELPLIQRERSSTEKASWRMRGSGT